MNTHTWFWYWIAKGNELTCDHARALLIRYNSPEEVFAALKRGGAACGGLGTARLQRLQADADLARLEEEMQRIEAAGIRLITPQDRDYPAGFREIAAAPALVFCRGRMPAPGERLIAVAGARQASPGGLRRTGLISYDLARAGVGIVSGMARGISGAAHRGALAAVRDLGDAAGRTYAVLGSGVDICYPGENRDIFESIPLTGGLLSEFVPGTRPSRQTFPRRNRLIAALSEGILVTEAREKSGSLITVARGLEQGKSVYALPGSPEDPTTEACNRLIREGAILTRNAGDILADLSFLTFGRQAGKNLLATAEKIVYACICSEPANIRQIKEDTGFELSELFAILCELERLKLVRRTDFLTYESCWESEH